MSNFLKAKLSCIDNCKIGDYIVVSFELDNLNKSKIDTDIPYKINEISENGLVLTREPYLDNNLVNFSFLSYKDGVFKIEPFKIKISDTEYLTQSFEFKVLGQTQELKLADIVPPQKIYPSTWYYLGLGSFVLVLLLVFYILIKKIKTKKKVVKEIFISPYEQALKKLSKIEFDKSLNLKKLVSGVTEAVKKFVSDEYSVDILDKTSTESIHTLKDNKIFELEKINMIKIFLNDADLIKFKDTHILNKEVDFINEARKLIYSLRREEPKNEI